MIPVKKELSICLEFLLLWLQTKSENYYLHTMFKEFIFFQKPNGLEIIESKKEEVKEFALEKGGSSLLIKG